MKSLPSYKQIWQITLPLLLGLIAESLVGVTDTAFLGHVGETEAAAAGYAGAFYIILFVVGMGFGTGTQILTSRRNGEQNFKQIGSIVENSLYFIWLFSAIVVVVALLLVGQIFGAVTNSPDVADASIRFLNIRVFTLFFSLGCVICSRFFVGIQLTKYIGIGALIVAGTNFILDYVLIFGKFGFPKMGLEGASLAAVLAEVVGLAYYIIIIIRKVDLAKYDLFRFKKPQLDIVRNTFNLSGFTMLQNLVSLIGWFLFFVIIEKTGEWNTTVSGERNLAVCNFVRSYYLLIIVPMWAFGHAVSTLVSNAIGAGQRRYVFQIIRRVSILCAGSMVIIFIFTICFSKEIMSLYTPNEVLINMGINGLWIVALANIIGGVTWTVFTAISATGNTQIALLIETVTTIVYVCVIYVLAHIFANRISFVWFSELVYYVVMGVGSFVYLSTNHWTKKQI
jgi:putative MATE family efflux protein